MAEPAMETDWVAITSEELEVLRENARRRGDEGSRRRLQMQSEDDEYVEFREAARERYMCAGKIEIDYGAVVSVSWDGGGGAYVAAPYAVAPRAGCVRVVDAYGRIYWRCV